MTGNKVSLARNPNPNPNLKLEYDRKRSMDGQEMMRSIQENEDLKRMLGDKEEECIELRNDKIAAQREARHLREDLQVYLHIIIRIHAYLSSLPSQYTLYTCKE